MTGLFVGGKFKEKCAYLPEDTKIHWCKGGHHFHLENSAKEIVSEINSALA